MPTRIGSALAFSMVLMVFGCAPSRSLQDFGDLSSRSELVLIELRQTTAAVFRSDADMDRKNQAMESLKRTQNAVLSLDLLTARLAGVPMTDAEAAQAREMLKTAYRHLSALAAMEAAALETPSDTPSTPPSRQASLDAVDDIVRRLSVLTGGG